MNRTEFRRNHRLARMGSLGTLAVSLGMDLYLWFLHEVYDLRHPHVGSTRHFNVRTYDSLRGKMVKSGHTLVRLRF